MSAITKVTKHHIHVRFTHRQASAIFSLVNASNADGDHYDWLRSAGATPAKLRATNEAMDIAGAMQGEVNAARERKATPTGP